MLSLTSDKQRYTFRYILALGVIAFLCLISLLVMNTAIEKAERDAPDVKMSAEQQMLSQRVAFLAHTFYTMEKDPIIRKTRKAEIDTIKKRVFGEIRRMKKNHKILISGSEERWGNFFPVGNSQTLRKLYYEVDTACIDYKLTTFFKEVVQLLNKPLEVQERKQKQEQLAIYKNFSGKKKKTAEQHFNDLSMMASVELYDALGVLVTYYEKESEKRIARLRAMVFGLMGLILLTLILVALLLFRPMVDKIIRDRNELINSQRKMTSILKTVGEGILSLNAQNQIVTANQEVENIWGYSEAELLKQPFHSLTSDNCRELHPSLWFRYRDDGIKGLTNELIELEGKRKDGSTFPLEIKITETLVDDEVLFIAAASDVTERKKAEQALLDAKRNLEKRVKERTGELQRANTKLTQEVTERKRAEKELKRSNSDLEQFAYVASHDLKEPIRMVSSYVQLLEQRYKKNLDDDGITFMNFAVEGAKRANALINDLLEYARINHDNNNFKAVSIEGVLLEVEQNLRIVIKENNALLNLPTQLPTIRANRMQMVRLFQNLIANAIKFRSKELPRIKIEVSENEHYYRFKVIDNGLGIEDKYKHKIFLIFQRLHNRNKYQGTGVGLAVCKKIVQHHEGRIWVDSELGKGSTFCFELPKHKVGIQKTLSTTYNSNKLAVRR